MDLLEHLRRLITQQTVNVKSVVTNVYGASAPPLTSLDDTTKVTWLKLAIPGAGLLSPDSFYAVWGNLTGKPSSILTAVAGMVVSEDAQYGIQLLRTTIRSPEHLSFPVGIETQGTAEFALYVDGVLQRTGSGSGSIPVLLDPGSHTLEVMAASKKVTLTLPGGITADGARESPAQPQWINVSGVWLDPITGTQAVELEWAVDPSVGGWKVFRRQLTFLAAIEVVGTPDASGMFAVYVSGNYSLAAGEEVHALHELMGVVTNSFYSEADDETTINVRLAPGLTASDQAWLGRDLTIGAFGEITRLERTATTGTVIVHDTNVTNGSTYEYALEAHGVLNATIVSLRSETRVVRAGDDTPPASITFVGGYPKVRDAKATIRFVPPADTDYAGVKVYFRRQYTATISSTTSNTAIFSGTPLTGLTLAGYTLLVLTSSTSGAVHETVTVQSNTSSSVTLPSTWVVAPAASSTVVIYKDFSVTTDYGQPSAEDELTFDTTLFGYGDYLFRSFDVGANEQTDAAALVWTYDSSDDVLGTLYFTNCTASILSATDTTIVVQVTGTSPDGTPQVKLTNVLDCTVTAGAAVGLLVASGSTWTITRPAALTHPGELTFQSVLAGDVTDDDIIAIPEQGRDTVALVCIARVHTTTATQVVFDVTVTDPYPGAVITLTPAGVGVGTISPSSAQTATSGIAVQFTIDRPTFATSGTLNGTGRIVFTATATGRVQDADAAEIPSADLLMPDFTEVPTETGTTGTLVIQVKNNLQSRVTRVHFISTVGRNAPTTADDTTVPYTGTVDLVAKNSSTIEYHVYGTDASGTADQEIGGGVVRFGVGSTPLPPDFKYTISAAGLVQVQIVGDSDTSYGRALLLDTTPIAGWATAIDASAAVSGTGNRLGVIPSVGTVLPGKQYLLGVRAYNSSDIGSDPTVKPVTWLGVGVTPDPTVVVNSMTVQSGRVTYNVTLSSAANEIFVYTLETDTDPGAGPPQVVPNVENRVAREFRTYSVGEPGIAVGVPFNIFLPLLSNADWLLTTFVVYDVLAQRGPVTTSVTAASAFPTIPASVVSTKVAGIGGGTPPSAPGAPTAAAGAHTSTSLTNTVTLSGSGTNATAIRPYVDGVAQADFTFTAANTGSFSVPTTGLTPSSTHTFKYSAVSAAGIESPLSATLTRTTDDTTGSGGTIPTPTILGTTAYSVDDQALVVVINPGTAPDGTIWHVEASNISITGGWTVQNSADTTATTLYFALQQGSTPHNYWVRVYGTLAGWTSGTPTAGYGPISVPSWKGNDF